MSIQQLEPMSFPLHGQRLIEASAGTGKTFTIAGLYLRLLLGHGGENAHATPLTVDQILVVTFTAAATQELRDRIRARIHDARVAFGRGSSSDPVIQPLLKAVSDHQKAEKLLLDAERQMDEAAIYTIHGFCQRMLTQNAFESGSLFQNEFITDETEIRDRAIADFWRKNFYPLPASLVGVIRSIWAVPQSIAKDIGNYLSGSEIEIKAPAMGDMSELVRINEQNFAKIDGMKAAWRAAMSDDLAKIVSDSGVDKRSYNSRLLPNWLEKIGMWAQSSTTDYKYPDELRRFSTTTLTEKTKKGKAPQHAVFDRVDAFFADPVFDLKVMLSAYAISEIRKRIGKEKKRFGWLSFDDLLTHLGNALDRDSAGRLAARIRELFPVAMIDEFQDTDPMQYHVFSSIYGGYKDTGIFMIGDPKQAIYAFRGADIFTYIHARREVTDHYNLGTNWRSSDEMVRSVNHIFEFAQSPFIYDQDIPFEPVKSSPGSEKRFWTIDGQKQAAMTFWLNEHSEVTKTADYQEEMADATVNSIHGILEKGQQGNAAFCKGDKTDEVKAGNIAVLVRTGREAALIKQKLAKHGIASVYLSDRNSVFVGEIASDLHRILMAVLSPEDERTVKGALGTHLLAGTAEHLMHLNQDEKDWEMVVLEFSQYQTLWFTRGVLPMLRQLMQRRGIAERFLTDEQKGERQLTDMLHIGELLQEAALRLDSHHALARWLHDQIMNPNGNSEQQQVRLESERDLVQIVTIHKSKGLEYDLVYLPFVCDYRVNTTPMYHDEVTHEAILDLLSPKEAADKADIERLAEDLRLIYVALTRPVYGCFVGLSPLKKGKKGQDCSDVHLSAFGYLLQGEGEKSPCELKNSVMRLIEGQPFMTIENTPEAIEGRLQVAPKDLSELKARKFKGVIDKVWGLTSYSRLMRQTPPVVALPEVPSFDMDAASEVLPVTEALAEPIERPAFSSIFQFPRGARPGTFLHTLFERVSFTQDMYGEAVSTCIKQLLRFENYEAEWLPVLQKLLHDVVNQPLLPEGLTLNQVRERDRVMELEFLMPVHRLNCNRVNQVIQTHDPLSAQAGELDFVTATGMLKGFVDLIFYWQGRYYILDWKSNYLGEQPDCYDPTALDRAMIDHRYDFQYQIYALALHRYLGQRLADYDYEQHFGGVFYLFLRGIHPESDHGIFFNKPKPALIQGLDDIFNQGDDA